MSQSSHNEEVEIQNKRIPKSENFWHISYIFNKNGETVDDIMHKIQVSWLKWRTIKYYAIEEYLLRQKKNSIEQL